MLFIKLKNALNYDFLFEYAKSFESNCKKHGNSDYWQKTLKTFNMESANVIKLRNLEKNIFQNTKTQRYKVKLLTSIQGWLH